MVLGVSPPNPHQPCPCSWAHGRHALTLRRGLLAMAWSMGPRMVTGGSVGHPGCDSHSSFPSTAILTHGRAKSSALCPWSGKGSCSEGQHRGEGPRALPSSPDPSEPLGLGEAGGGAMARS